MKRLARRQSILTSITIAVAAVWVSVIYVLVFGKSPLASGVAGLGLMFFLPAVLIFCLELNMAYAVGSLRDDEQDDEVAALKRELAAVKRRLGMLAGDDTPPHGRPVVKEAPR